VPGTARRRRVARVVLVHVRRPSGDYARRDRLVPPSVEQAPAWEYIPSPHCTRLPASFQNSRTQAKYLQKLLGAAVTTGPPQKL
jgi:hypothetical protein